MEQKGEHLAHAKGQAGLVTFDLSIQLLGQLPESVGLGQSLVVLTDRKDGHSHARMANIVQPSACRGSRPEFADHFGR